MIPDNKSGKEGDVVLEIQKRGDRAAGDDPGRRFDPGRETRAARFRNGKSANRNTKPGFQSNKLNGKLIKPEILILSTDAQEYLPLLQELIVPPTDIQMAATVDEARDVYSGQPVILGEPDLIAGALNDMSGVRWVQSSWAGVTPLIDLGRSDYILTGIKDIFGLQMAEYVLAYLLAHEIRIFERLGRQANRNWWDQTSGTLNGKSLGIMGTGSIGQHIAKMAEPFGVGVTGYSRSGSPVEGFQQVFAQHQLTEFLQAPDYIVGVLPDTPGSQGLLDDAAFGAMKNGCYLVNVGRGSLIDETALVDALLAGKLAGAVLDVFRTEPLPDDSVLWNAPGLIVTGHVAATSWPRDIARIFSENYQRFVAGEPLKYRIDFDQGY
jgi:phosphoglycerate dehydrogenase-like enzyme